MIKWLVIGLVLWYFYRRFTRRTGINRRPDDRYIRDEGFRDKPGQRTTQPIDEDDYIDYEEVQ